MEENKELIQFSFEWNPKNYDNVAPNVKELAIKLVELNLVKVEKDLDSNGNIIILHTGVCKKQGLVECLSAGIVNENIYSYKFSTKPNFSLNTICQGRDESKVNYCKMPSCPIVLAGYLWYLKYKDNTQKQVVEIFDNNITENDRYLSNYNELKKMELNSELEEILQPLAMPNIKGLRCAFVGDEGTDKDGMINKVAEYLYRIGKISSSKPVEINMGGDFNLQDDKLYSIVDIQNYLNAIANNDDFSNAAESGRKINKGNITKLVSQTKGKYIIINTTPLELKKFLESNSKLPYIFDQTIYFKDYEDEKIWNMFEKNLTEYHKKKITENTKKEFLQYLSKNRKYFPFKNEELSLFLAGYVSRKNEFVLPKERYQEKTFQEMFSDLIGMNNIKNQILEFNSFLKLQKKLESKGKKIPSFNLHMMFLGNPGTRKDNSCKNDI